MELPREGKEICDMSKEYNYFTWVPQNEAKPIAIERGEGCNFYDYDGNKYFDMCSQQVYLNIGFNNQKVIKTIQEQVARLANVAPHYTTGVRAALGKKIIQDLAPDNMGKVMFTLGGADANEYAIRIAKKYTGRYKIFSQYYAYHGSTYGATNLNGEDDRVTPDPAIGGFVKFFGPNWKKHGIKFATEEEECRFYVEMLREQLILEDPRTVAAIFFETITGSNGAIVPPKGYFEAVRAICDEYGIMMVCDEVMSGFCRTGEWFACQNFDFQPDIITFAKGVTCGYTPLGGVIVSKAISKYYDDAKFPCGLTYSGHALSCSAALAVIEVYEEENLRENAKKMGDFIKEGLEKIKEKHPCINEVRGMGLMRAFNLVDEFQSPEWHDIICDKLKEKGYSTFGHFGVILVCPPLIVTQEECQGILDVIDEVLVDFDEIVKAKK